MHISHRYLSEFLTLPPVLVAQAGLWRLLLQNARQRFSKRAFQAVAAGAALAAILILLGLLSEFEGLRFTRFLSLERLQAIHTVTYLWAFASSAAYCIYVVYWFFLVRRPMPFQPERRRVIHAAGAAAIAAPFAATAFGTIVQRIDFHVREVDIPVSGLAPDLEGLRLLQLSDIHLSPYLSEREFARVIDASNELRPQIGLITGDLISYRNDPLDAAFRQLKRLRTDAGLIACHGNHENYAGVLEIATQMGERAGIPFLRGQSRSVKFGGAVLNFGGVDYQSFDNRPGYLEGAEKLLDPNAVNILLSHNPDVFPVAARQGWDLTLSGHTHGGQVTFEILEQTMNLARVFTPYVSGYYRIGKSSSYVTRGIGTIGLPLRLGATPEITLLRLRKA